MFGAIGMRHLQGWMVGKWYNTLIWCQALTSKIGHSKNELETYNHDQTLWKMVNQNGTKHE